MSFHHRERPPQDSFQREGQGLSCYKRRPPICRETQFYVESLEDSVACPEESLSSRSFQASGTCRFRISYSTTVCNPVQFNPLMWNKNLRKEVSRCEPWFQEAPGSYLSTSVEISSDTRPAKMNLVYVQVRGGTVDFQPLTGPAFSIPVTSISSADQTAIAALLGRVGQTADTLTAGADPNKTLALKITILHAPDRMTKITTPVGVTSHFATFISSLTLWKLLPPLINVNSIQAVRIRVVVSVSTKLKDCGSVATHP